MSDSNNPTEVLADALANYIRCLEEYGQIVFGQIVIRHNPQDSRWVVECDTAHGRSSASSTPTPALALKRMMDHLCQVTVEYKRVQMADGHNPFRYLVGAEVISAEKSIQPLLERLERVPVGVAIRFSQTAREELVALCRDMYEWEGEYVFNGETDRAQRMMRIIGRLEALLAAEPKETES